MLQGFLSKILEHFSNMYVVYRAHIRIKQGKFDPYPLIVLNLLVGQNLRQVFMYHTYTCIFTFCDYFSYYLSFQRAIVSEAKMQVAFEVMNFQATSNADNASYLASLPVSAASSTQVDSFPFNYLKMDDDATLTVMNSCFVSGLSLLSWVFWVLQHKTY